MIPPGLKFAAMMILGFLTGCTGKYVAPTSQPTGSPYISIVADSENINVGGATTFTITANNRSGTVMDFGRGSSSCWFGIQIVGEESGQIVSFSRACTKDFASRYLEPGEKHSEVVTWRARVRVEDEIVNVSPGVYQVRAVANDILSSPITIRVRD